MNLIWIGIGGFLGAISRYGSVLYIKKRVPSMIPAGTLTVNLAGSFLLGLLIGMNVNEGVFSFLGIGFMGAFTTFSTFKLETIQLLEAKKKKAAIFYLGITYIGGIFFAFFGFIIGGI